jgi:hypothetical protein
LVRCPSFRRREDRRLLTTSFVKKRTWL